MKNFLFCTFICLFSIGYNHAQISVNNTTFPQVGDKLLTYQLNNVSNVNIGLAGENRTYDFNSLTGGNPDVTSFLEKNEGRNAASFPDANVFIKSGDGENELYARILSSRIELVGFSGENPLFGEEVVIPYNKRPIYRRSPMFYETNSLSEGSFRLDFGSEIIPDTFFAGLPFKPDSIRIQLASVTRDTIDGWGKVLLKGQQFDVLREKAITISDNKLFVKVPILNWVDPIALLGGNLPGGIGNFFGIDTSYTYNYYTNTRKEVLVSIDVNRQNIPQFISYADVEGTISSKDINFNSLVEIFPNPVSDLIKVSLDGLPADDYTFCLYTMDGKLLTKQQKRINGEKQLDISIADFLPGFYLLNIENSKSSTIVSKRIVIQR